MNDKLKIAIGAGVGACVGWFIGAVIAEYIDMLEFERSNVYCMTDEIPTEETEDNQRPTEMSKNPKNKTLMVDYTKHYVPTEQDKIDLNVLAAKYNQGVLPPDEDEEEEVFVEPKEDIDSGPIRIISVSEFATSDKKNHVTILYFDDDIATDENRKIIQDPEKFIGEEALVSFGILSEMEDTVYIRNEERQTDYEVIRMDEPFINKQGQRPSRFDHLKENDDEEGEDS